MGRYIPQLAAGCWLAAAGVADAFEAPSGGPSLSSDLFNPKPYSLQARLWAGYDSNVLLVPDLPPYYMGDTEASPMAGITLNGSYRVPVATHVVVGAAMRVDGKLYTAKQGPGVDPANDDPASYSLLVLHPTLFAELDFTHGAIPTKATFTYGFRRENGHGVQAMGLNSHQFGARFDAGIAPNLDLYVAVQHTVDDFDVVFTDPASDRDGTNTSVSIGGRYSFDGHRRSIGISLAHVSNNAIGANWDYTGWSVSADLRSHIHGRLYGQIGMSYSARDYAGGFVPDVGPPGRTKQQITSVEGSLKYVFNRTLTADAFATYKSYGANMTAFAGDRWTVGLGLTAKLP